MDADDIFKKELLNEIKRIAKINKVKYSPRFWGMYKVNEDYVWQARVIPGLLLSNNTIDVQLFVSVGATCFDEILASIVYPDEDVHITELQHAAGIYVGPVLLIAKKKYIYQLGGDDSIEKIAHDAAEEITEEALKNILSFKERIMSKYPDIVSYMLTLKESNPMECGLAHLANGEYQLAEDCFKFATDNKKLWHISYGPKARMLHLILIDYCFARQNGIEWKNEYVVNGLS